MNYLDFKYNGRMLSNCLGDNGKHFVICDFNPTSDVKEDGKLSETTFNQLYTYGNYNQPIISSENQTPFSTTFDICVRPKCFDNRAYLDGGTDDNFITEDEFHKLCAWLLQREYKEIRFYDVDGSRGELATKSDSDLIEYNLMFNAVFNISRLTLYDKLYGLRLEMLTDSPFAVDTDSDGTYTQIAENDETKANNVILMDFHRDMALPLSIKPKITIYFNDDDGYSKDPDFSYSERKIELLMYDKNNDSKQSVYPYWAINNKRYIFKVTFTIPQNVIEDYCIKCVVIDCENKMIYAKMVTNNIVDITDFNFSFPYVCVNNIDTTCDFGFILRGIKTTVDNETKENYPKLKVEIKNYKVACL